VNGTHAQQLGAIFRIQSKIDGLNAAEWNVSKIGDFAIRPGGSEDPVLTATPEKLADPFRSWLNSQNSPRAGTLN
jgi:hypothetical protein